MTPLGNPSLTGGHVPYTKEEDEELLHVGASSMPSASTPLHGHSSLRHRPRLVNDAGNQTETVESVHVVTTHSRPLSVWFALTSTDVRLNCVLQDIGRVYTLYKRRPTHARGHFLPCVIASKFQLY